MNNAALKGELAQIFINSADLVEYAQADGTKSKTLFVRIPHRSLAAFRKVAEKVVAHLEGKFNWPVVVVANRTIISKHGNNLCADIFSQETQNSKETQEQDSDCRKRCYSGRYRNIYYKRSLI